MDIKFEVDEVDESSVSFNVKYNRRDTFAIFVNIDTVYKIELYIYESTSSFCIMKFNINDYYEILRLFIKSKNIDFSSVEKTLYSIYDGSVGEIENGEIILDEKMEINTIHTVKVARKKKIKVINIL